MTDLAPGEQRKGAGARCWGLHRSPENLLLPGDRPVWPPDDHPLPSAVLRGKRQADQVGCTHPSHCGGHPPGLGGQSCWGGAPRGTPGSEPQDATGCCWHPKSWSCLWQGTERLLLPLALQGHMGTLLPASHGGAF